MCLPIKHCGVSNRIKDKNNTLSDTVQVSQATEGTCTGDIIFETEQNLIDFQTAGYTKVMGNIIVQGDNIRTLQKLNNLLQEIDGNLTINCHSLTSLDGLYNLKKITGDFITERAGITSYEGINNLTEIGGNFKVIAESSSSYDSYSLASLSSFKGLSGLKSIGGDFEVNVKSSSSSSSSLKLAFQHCSASNHTTPAQLQRTFISLDSNTPANHNMPVENKIMTYRPLSRKTSRIMTVNIPANFYQSPANRSAYYDSSTQIVYLQLTVNQYGKFTSRAKR